MPLTPEQVKKYLDDAGGHCPFCDEGNIEGDVIEIEGGTAHQECHCTECGKYWYDGYKLDSVVELRGD